MAVSVAETRYVARVKVEHEATQKAMEKLSKLKTVGFGKSLCPFAKEYACTGSRDAS